MDAFEKQVREQIRKYHMFDGAGHVICGVSGGADSVSLFTVLARHQEMFKIKLHVVHINHMIRGEAADRDQEFVEKLCEDYGVCCKSFRIDVPGLARQKGLTLEEAGRIARYRLFEQERQRYVNEGCVIAVAHNRNDVAETVLFNMARGTGIGGIKGITPKRDVIVRPLLSSDRRDIEAYLDRNNISYCTDCTNEENEYARNRIRNMVLPELCRINNQAVKHIYDMAELALKYELMAAELVESFFVSQNIDIKKDMVKWTSDHDSKRRYRVDLEALRTQNELVGELAIRQLIGMVSGGLKDVTRQHVREVMKLYDSCTGASITLPGGARAYREYGWLVFATEKALEDPVKEALKCDRLSIEIDMERDGVYKVPGGVASIRMYDRTTDTAIIKKDFTKYLDYDKIEGSLRIRTAQKDDYIVVNTVGSKKKINRFFTDRKVPLEKRENVLLLVADSEVLWVIGDRIGENYKVTDDTKRIFEITFDREA